MKYARLLLAAAIAAAPLPFAPAAASATIDTSARDRVIAAYLEEFSKVVPDAEWDGDVQACMPGTTSAAHQAFVLDRLNWYRDVAGVTPVGYAAEFAPAAQAAAAYQARSASLSHTITPGTPCYSDLAAQGSLRSNLVYGSFGADSVAAYMVDAGANNTAVGHRAWLLNPRLGPIATGDVNTHGTNVPYNAIYVAGPSATPATPRDGYVAWPAPGHFPDALTPERWSFALPHLPVPAGFTDATVTITGPAGTITPPIVNRNGTLVFEPGSAASVATDTTWDVTIANVTNAPQTTYRYQVTQVDVPTRPRFRWSSTYGASTCTAPGARLGTVGFTGQDLSFSLVAGRGDADNALFQVDATGTFSAVGQLPLERTSYAIRVRATHSSGLSNEVAHTFTLKDARDLSTKPCPVRNPSATMVGKLVNIRWDLPSVVRTGATYKVWVGDRVGCSSAGTLCAVEGLAPGSHEGRIWVYLDGRYSASTSFSFSVPEAAAPTARVPAGSTVALATSRRYRIATLVQLPKGQRRYSVKGPCTLSKDRRYLRLSATPGRCTLTVRATRKAGARRITSTHRWYFLTS